MPNAKLCLRYRCWQYLFVLYVFISVSEAFFLLKTTLDYEEYYIAILKNKKKDFRKELLREIEEEKRQFFLTSIVPTEVYLGEQTIKYRFVTDLDSENSRVDDSSHTIGIITETDGNEPYVPNSTNVNNFTPKSGKEEKSAVSNTDKAVEKYSISTDTKINKYFTTNNKEEKSTASKTDKAVDNDSVTTDIYIKNYSATTNNEEQTNSKVTVVNKFTSPDNKQLSNFTTVTKKEIVNSTVANEISTKNYQKDNIDEKKKITHASNSSVATDKEITILKSTVHEEEINYGQRTEKQTITCALSTDNDKYHESSTSTTNKETYKYFTSPRVSKYTTEITKLTELASISDKNNLHVTWNNDKNVNQYTSLNHKTKENNRTNTVKEEKTNSIVTSSVRHVADVQTSSVITEMTKNISITNREIQNVTCDPFTSNISNVHTGTNVGNKITTCYCKPVSTTMITYHPTTKKVRPKKRKHHQCHTHKPKHFTFKKTTEGCNPTRKALRFNFKNKMRLETKIFFSPTKVIKYKEVPNKIIKLKKRPVLETNCSITICNCGMVTSSYEVPNFTTSLISGSRRGTQHNKNTNDASTTSIIRKRPQLKEHVKKNSILENQYEMSTSAKKESVTEKTTQKFFRKVRGTKTTPQIVPNPNCMCCKNLLLHMKKENSTEKNKLLKESSNWIPDNTLTTTPLSLTAKKISKSPTNDTNKQPKAVFNKSNLDSKGNRNDKNGIRMDARQLLNSCTTSEVVGYDKDDNFYDYYYEDYDEDYSATTALNSEVELLRERIGQVLPLHGMSKTTVFPSTKKEYDYFRKRSTLFVHPVSRRKINFDDVTLPTKLEYMGQNIYNLAKGLRNELKKKESDLRKIREKELFVKEWLGNLNQIQKRCEHYENGLNRARKHNIKKLWNLLNLTKIELHVEERINRRLNKILHEVKQRI